MPWSVNKGGSYMSTPVIYNDHLFVATGSVVRCYNAKTGEKVYESRLETGAAIIDPERPPQLVAIRCYHARSSAPGSPSMPRRIAVATPLLRAPRLALGPTQDGQPNRQAHFCTSCSAARRISRWMR